MQASDKIYIAGHRGMVGSAIVRKLQNEGFTNLITKTSAQLDLRNQKDVSSFFQQYKPDLVVLAAAKVGGIVANSTYRAEFLYDNLMIQSNVIHQSYMNNVQKLLFLGSSCIYPAMAAQPIREEYLLTGPLEFTNEPYAIAKIAGIKMCESYRQQYGCNYISAMPTNLYGPNDNYHLQNSHVLPALIRKFHSAKVEEEANVSVWGSGMPRREFMHADDLADACYFLLRKYDGIAPVNIGTGKDLSIYELSMLIKRIVGFEGEVVFDKTRPDGTIRKLMDVSRIHQLGWKHSIELEKGIAKTYVDFLQNYKAEAGSLCA